MSDVVPSERSGGILGTERGQPGEGIPGLRIRDGASGEDVIPINWRVNKRIDRWRETVSSMQAYLLNQRLGTQEEKQRSKTDFQVQVCGCSCNLSCRPAGKQAKKSLGRRSSSIHSPGGASWWWYCILATFRWYLCLEQLRGAPMRA